jgi:hypothetical protein
MKLLIATLFALTATVTHAQSMSPTLIDANFHTSYVPYGFDTNDHIQFVAEGTFTNTCFRPAYYGIKVDHANKKVYLAPKAYQYDGMCAMALVHYSQVIDLGLMQAGRYDILQKEPTNVDEATESNAYNEIGKLSVRIATNSSPDDHLYAPIGQAYWQAHNGNAKVTLTGAFSNSCWKFDKTAVDVQGNVIVIQPISYMEEGVACKQMVVPFKKEVEINNINKGRYLLHIRSTNAKAVNSLVDVN